MYFPKLSLCALAFLGVAQSFVSAKKSHSTSADVSSTCVSSSTDFSEGLGDWTEESGKTSGWEITNEGLVMTLLPPKKYVRMTNSSDSDNPYNKYEAQTSPNFVYPDLMQYGSISYVLKVAGTTGTVTAPILMAPGGDEIDFEMLGAEHNKVQTNYFYGSNLVYGVNGGNTELDIDTTEFHNYTIDWNAERINFIVDGKTIRTVKNADDCDKSGDCTYPTHAAQPQVGLWDASTDSSTAEWAGGPIDWNNADSVSATVKSVTIRCKN